MAGDDGIVIVVEGMMSSWRRQSRLCRCIQDVTAAMSGMIVGFRLGLCSRRPDERPMIPCTCD